MNMCMRAFIQTCVCIYVDTCVHVHVNMCRTVMHAHMCTRAQMCVHTCIHTHGHIDTHACTSVLSAPVASTSSSMELTLGRAQSQQEDGQPHPPPACSSRAPRAEEPLMAHPTPWCPLCPLLSKLSLRWRVASLPPAWATCFLRGTDR